MGKNIYGKCSICGEYKKLTFEHFPPEKAFNNTPVYHKNHDNLFEKDSYYYGKRMLSNQGTGDYTLCQTCNNNTGDWYGRDYIQWAYQGGFNLSANNDKNFINCFFMIRPLNILKQIISFFLSIDKSEIIRNNKTLVNFVVNKDSNEFPDNIKIYMYINKTPHIRCLGYCWSTDISFATTNKWAEFSFRPFGYLFCEDSQPANDLQYDITFFKNYKYNEMVNLELPLYNLEFSSVVIGTYDNLNSIKKTFV